MSKKYNPTAHNLRVLRDQQAAWDMFAAAALAGVMSQYDASDGGTKMSEVATAVSCIAHYMIDERESGLPAPLNYDYKKPRRKR